MRWRRVRAQAAEQRRGEMMLREELDQLALHELVARVNDPVKVRNNRVSYIC